MNILGHLVPLLTIVPVLIFWLWMFRHMVNNPDIPDGRREPIKWPPVTKRDWTVFFVIFSIAMALYYYANVYRRR